MILSSHLGRLQIFEFVFIYLLRCREAENSSATTTLNSSTFRLVISHGWLAEGGLCDGLSLVPFDSKENAETG